MKIALAALALFLLAGFFQPVVTGGDPTLLCGLANVFGDFSAKHGQPPEFHSRESVCRR